jgi:endonuclease YncB( thermonuclease family)
MRRIVVALLLLFPAAAMAEVSGSAMVMDGDTVTVEGQDISLYGVNAPSIVQSCGIDEGMWQCGWEAANRLEEIIAGRSVTCTDIVEDENGHMVGRCSVEGEDLAGAMVDEGLAVANADTGADYQARAMAASDAKVGMWSGPFIDPLTWAEIGGCGCSARKQSMMETAALLKAQRAAEEAEAEEDLTN